MPPEGVVLLPQSEHALGCFGARRLPTGEILSRPAVGVSLSSQNALVSATGVKK